MSSVESQQRSNRKISWSRNGFIAFSDLTSSTNLSITKLQAIKGSSWRLSPKKTYQVKASPVARLHEVKIIQWSISGSDLAVIDEVGNLTILGTGISKTSSNSGTHQVSCFEDIEIFYQDDLLNELNLSNNKNLNLSKDTFFTDVLSFKWLNADKPVIYNSPATKTNDNTYNYSVHQYKPYGVIHPIQGKAGCFAIRRNGGVSFYYQTLGQQTEFKKINTFLESEGEEFIDHASIGYNRDGSVIITTFNLLNYHLRIYKVTIDWGSTPNEKLNPVLKIEKLISDTVDRFGSNGLLLQFNSLDVISSNFSLETELDILLSFTGPGVVNGKTLLQKYQISNEFNNLRFKSEVVTIEGYPNLKLINEIIINERIVDIKSEKFDFSLILVTENGEIQIRSRKTLNLHNHSNTAVSSLIDVGFKFKVPEKIPESIVVSPCLCGYVSLNHNEVVYEPLIRNERISWNEDEKAALSAGFSYLFASACYTNTSADELIETAQEILFNIDSIELKESLTLKILEESHRALNFSLDVSKDQIDRLLVNPPVQKLLSFQYSLGKYLSTNEQSTIALSVLNLRLISFSAMLSLRTLFHQQQRIAKKGNIETLIESLHRCENLLSTLGTVNWFIEFLIFVLQELIKLSVNPNHKTIVLSLVLSKIPRSLIIYSIAGIKRIDGFLTKVDENYANNKQNQIPLSLEMFNSSVDRFRHLLKLVSLDTFEQFLNEVEITLSNANGNNSGIKIEQELVFLNKVPSVYSSSIPQIFKLFQDKFMNLNLSSLFFHDTTWLNFQIKNNEIPKYVYIPKGETIQPTIDLTHDLIDDVTKTKIIKKEKLKKCVRCEYITSGLNTNETFTILGGSLNGLPMMNSSHWPVAFQRTCICGSCWIYANEDEIIEN